MAKKTTSHRRTKASNKTGGRPPGSKTRDYPQAEAQLTRCPRCGSTERQPYREGPIEHAHHGLTPTGEPYTHIVWRHTACKSCGQHRKDKSYENRLPAEQRPTTKTGNSD